MPRLSSKTRFVDSSARGCRVLVREWAGSGVSENPATVLVVHGLGDHTARHDWAAGLVVRTGMRAVGFDWPGNGRSDGVRGDMPTVHEAAMLLEEMLDALDLAPVGIFAHSTGAFLVLSWLAREGNRLARLSRLRWVWFSSPLVRPSQGQPRLKIALAKALARRFPRMTLGNGVRARDCYHPRPLSGAETDFAHDGGHHRVSLRFATSLLEAEEGILGEAHAIRPDLACLITQGAEDPICRPSGAENLFRALPGRKKTLILVSGSRHEPFREVENEGVTRAVGAWLDSLLPGRGGPGD